MDAEELLGAWRANEAVTQELLAVCIAEDLDLKPGKGKTIRSNFVHIVSVRRAWVEEKLRTEAAEVPKLDWKTATLDELKSGLAISSAKVEKLLLKRIDAPKPDRWGRVLMFFAYLVAHDAHHRSQVEIALRLNGREISDEQTFSYWEWAKK